MTISIGVALFVMTWAFWTDIRFFRISNRLTVTACLAAWLFLTVSGGMKGLAAAAAGTAAGLLPLLLLHVLGGIGAGDVKLFGALGAWLGVSTVLSLLLYSILFAGVIGLLLAALQHSPARRVVDRFATGSGIRGLQFPFMLAVAPGAAALWL